MVGRLAVEVLNVAQRFLDQRLDVVVVRRVEDAVSVTPGADYPSEAEFGQVVGHRGGLHVEMAGQLVDRMFTMQQIPDDPQSRLICQQLQSPHRRSDLTLGRLFNYLRHHLNSLPGRQTERNIGVDASRLSRRPDRSRDDRGMRLVDLDPRDPRLEQDVLPVLRELRPHLTPATFSGIYQEGYRQGLRYLAAYDGEQCVGVAGWRLVATTHVARKVHVDDLVTAASERSRGVGAALLSELIDRARAADCTVLDLDSGVQRADAHRFYMREGLTITSFHFTLRLV